MNTANFSLQIQIILNKQVYIKYAIPRKPTDVKLFQQLTASSVLQQKNGKNGVPGAPHTAVCADGPFAHSFDGNAFKCMKACEAPWNEVLVRP